MRAEASRQGRAGAWCQEAQVFPQVSCPGGPHPPQLTCQDLFEGGNGKSGPVLREEPATPRPSHIDAALREALSPCQPLMPASSLHPRKHTWNLPPKALLTLSQVLQQLLQKRGQPRPLEEYVSSVCLQGHCMAELALELPALS